MGSNQIFFRQTKAITKMNKMNKIYKMKYIQKQTNTNYNNKK